MMTIVIQISEIGPLQFTRLKKNLFSSCVVLSMSQLCIENPLAWLDEKLLEANGNGDQVKKWFEQELSSNELLMSSIPRLSTDQHAALLRRHQLVRFVGLIQDVRDPEYYFSKCNVDNRRFSTKFRENFVAPSKSKLKSASSSLSFHAETNSVSRVVVVGNNSDNNDDNDDGDDDDSVVRQSEPRDRLPLYCTPIPELNHWASQLWFNEKSIFANRTSSSASSSSSSSSSSSPPVDRKRRRNQDAMLDDDDEDKQKEKKTVDDDDNDDDDDDEHRFLKKKSVDESARREDARFVDMNFCAGDDAQLTPGLVKVYDNYEGRFKLNELVEFYGVLDMVPLSSVDDVDDDFDADEADERVIEERRRYDTQIPCVHAITWRKLPGAFPQRLALRDADADKLPAARRMLTDHVTALLGGDALAGNYVALNLMSSVHDRRELRAIGGMPINLVVSSPGGGAAAARALADFLSQVLPASASHTLSRGALGARPFSPYKNYALNRLMSAPLQLAAGTHLLLDETALSQGSLNAIAMHNLTAIHQLLARQQVTYDFQYHKLEFNVDVPAIVVSHTTKSLFHTSCPCVVYVEPRASSSSSSSSSSSAVPPPPLSDVKLNALRAYINHVRSARYLRSVGESLQRAIEEDFVQARQNVPTTVLSADTLHLWLTLASLIARCDGKAQLDDASWALCKRLESARMNRFMDRLNVKTE
jgi:Mini-chromosome maintenance replisome factor